MTKSNSAPRPTEAFRNERSLRTWANEQLKADLDKCGMSRLPGEMWPEARTAGYIDDAISHGDPDNEKGASDDLLTFLRGRLRYVRLGKESRSGEIRLNIGPPSLSAYEQRRAEVYSEWLASLASQSELILEERAKLRSYCAEAGLAIESEPLMIEDTSSGSSDTLTTATAIAFLQHYDCRGTQVTISQLGRYETLAWPPNGVPNVPLVRPIEGMSYDDNGDEYERPMVVEGGLLSPSGARLIFRRSGELGNLVSRARWIAKYYFWTPEQALWFILTGQHPVIPPVLIGFNAPGYGGSLDHHPSEREYHPGYARGVITIQVEPWVSPQTLMSVYVDARKQLLARSHSSIVGLEAWSFVASHLRVGHSIRGLFKKWQARKQGAYQGHKQNFWAIVHRTEDAVLRAYEWMDDEQDEETPTA